MTLGPSAGREITLKGRITEVHFLGSVIRIRIDLGGNSVLLDTFNTPDTPPPAVGTDAEISVAERDLMVLED